VSAAATIVVVERVLVQTSAGPAWDGGHIREQPGWDEHAAFIDALTEEGKFLMGGPRADNRGSFMIFRRTTATEVRELLRFDPFVLNGVFVIDDVVDWSTIVDPLDP
jgi:uncharacterized protein YciI